MRYLFSCLVLLSLSACQHSSQWQQQPLQELYADHYFIGPAAEIETLDDIFRLPAETEAEVRKFVGRQHTDMHQRGRELLEYLFYYADTGLSYEHSATSTAQETLHLRRANCLSLSILTYSLAKAAGLQAEFQDVQIPEYWVSRSGLSFLNGHVNLRLKASTSQSSLYSYINRDVIVDFDPYSKEQSFPVSVITETTVLAMFYNNKAAQAQVDQNYPLAYQYYKAATQADPGFSVSWANLAVLYRITGLTDYALKAYQHSLALNPRATNTLSNLAVLYRSTGDIAQAELLERRVLAQRRNNPYYHVMLGDEQLPRQPEEALRHYRQALSLNAEVHEAYYGIAQSYYLQGNVPLAGLYLEKASQHSSSTDDQRRYQHKRKLLTHTSAVSYQ